MTTNSPNPVDGDVQALIERLNKLAEKLKWHNVGYAQDIVKAVDLLTTPPAQLLRPVELPGGFSPAIGDIFDRQAPVMRRDKEDGEWLHKVTVAELLRSLGHEVE